MSLCSRALERQYSFLLLNVMRALAKSQKTCKHGAGSLRLARVCRVVLGRFFVADQRRWKAVSEHITDSASATVTRIQQ